MMLNKFSTFAKENEPHGDYEHETASIEKESIESKKITWRYENAFKFWKKVLKGAVRLD